MSRPTMINWTLHGGNSDIELAAGRTHFAYVDGHATPKALEDLVDSGTGLSTLDSMWSPLDPQINAP